MLTGELFLGEVWECLVGKDYDHSECFVTNTTNKDQMQRIRF